MHSIKMLMSVIVLLFLTLVLSIAVPKSGNELRTRMESKGYRLNPTTFQLDIGDGKFAEYSGDLDEAIAHFEKEYPHISTTSANAMTNHTISQRDTWPGRIGGQFCCPVPGQPWGLGKSIDSNWAWQELIYNINLFVIVEAGPAWCTPVRCAGEITISVCNDEPVHRTIYLPYIGYYAGQISTLCGHNIGYGKTGLLYTCGQIFNDADHWNVIVAAGGRF